MSAGRRYVASAVFASMLMMFPAVAVQSAEATMPSDDAADETFVFSPRESFVFNPVIPKPTPMLPPRDVAPVQALGVETRLLDPKGRPAWPCADDGTYTITGYVRTEFSPWTHDGTSVYTDEDIVAASWNLPHGSLVRIEGLEPTFRVADRGHLGARHLDVAVWTRSEAFALTSERRVCVVRRGR